MAQKITYPGVFNSAATGGARLMPSGEMAAASSPWAVAHTTVTVSGAWVSASNFIPAGTVALGIVGTVEVAVSGTSYWRGWNLGISGSQTQWAAAMPGTVSTASTVGNFDKSYAADVYPAATDVWVTSSGAEAVGGRIALKLIYSDLTWGG